MKIFIVGLLLGVSVASFAALVPTEDTESTKASVSGTDLTQHKIMRKETVARDTMDKETLEELKRYKGVLTADNVEALENMSRLLQNNPEKLLGVDLSGGGLDIGERVIEPGQEVVPYVSGPKVDDPVQRFANMQVPELTAAMGDAYVDEETLDRLYAQALAQVEQIGHKHLGQKKAPIARALTVEDIEEMGIDTTKLPAGWEENLKKAQEMQKEIERQQSVK